MLRSLSIILLALITAPALSATADPTAATLRRCLADPVNGSTAGQTTCQAGAAQSYDRRLNTAYRALLRALPPAAAQRLRVAQRAWLTFRAADSSARSALYETRQGTMFVPMQAQSEADVVRDRAVQLEAYLRAMRID
jgi:uncharacterized protein YecT (DUF1311 family)